MKDMTAEEIIAFAEENGSDFIEKMEDTEYNEIENKMIDFLAQTIIDNFDSFKKLWESYRRIYAVCDDSLVVHDIIANVEETIIITDEEITLKLFKTEIERAKAFYK
jgi:hypothetical protein